LVLLFLSIDVAIFLRTLGKNLCRRDRSRPMMTWSCNSWVSARSQLLAIRSSRERF